MGFADEEIELGFSTICQEGDTERNVVMMRNMFPEEFSRQSHPMDQNNWCNSLMRSSLSNNPSFPETLMMQAASNSIDEEDAIIKDMIHVLCSSSSSPDNNYPNYYDDDHQNMSSGSTPTTCVVHPAGDGVISSSSAFKRYNREDNNNLGIWRPKFGRQSKLKRLFEMFRGLHNAMRVMSINYNEATPSRLHHMISERRRRQKLNHNFQALAALLPPPTKKDQASILTRAKETLRCLRADIEELTKRKLQLEAEIEANKLILLGSTSSYHEEITKRDWRLSVGVSSVSENVEERMIEVQVSVRGTITKVDHILIGVLEFFKGLDHNVVTLISMAANTHASQVAPSNIHELALSLRIEEGTEWDKAAFLEALRRVVADLVQ